MKKLLNKEVCEFREQYTRPTEQSHSSENLDCQKGGGSHALNPLNSTIPVKIWIVKEVVSPVHSARDPLKDTPT